MQLDPGNAALVVYTCCILHNLISLEKPRAFMQHVAEQPHPANPNLFWQNPQTLAGLQQNAGNTGREAAKEVRNHLKDYYNSHVGEVPYQNEAVRHHVIIMNFIIIFEIVYNFV